MKVFFLLLPGMIAALGSPLISIGEMWGWNNQPTLFSKIVITYSCITSYYLYYKIFKKITIKGKKK